MIRSIFLAAAALGSLGISTLPVQAQTSRPVGIQRSRVASPHTLTRTPADTSAASAGTYVIGGAIAGVLATGVGLTISFRQSNSEFIGSPFTFVPLFLGSAGIGAAFGYILYRVRN